MEREVFLKEYEKAHPIYNYAHVLYAEIKKLDDASGKRGEELEYKSAKTTNLVVAMEELAELQQQISKVIRGKTDDMGLIEEIADVEIMLEYIKDVLCITEFQVAKAKNVKIERFRRRLDNEAEE